MGERAPYSRVYWSVVDDPKFETIYSDDHHLATWLRLLIAADAIWPASATLPAGVRVKSVEALTAAGLVDMLTGHRYRIHGLDAERGRRARTNKSPDGDQQVPSKSPDGPSRAGALLVSSRLSSSGGVRGGPPEEKPWITLSVEERAEHDRLEKDEAIRQTMLRVGLKPEPVA